MVARKDSSYYASTSFWLEDNGVEKIRPKLNESETVDIAILGAGFTGLWTAYYLLEENPNLNISILEKEIVGFGASGRNGGWCSPRYAVSTQVCIERYGVETTKSLMSQMFESVNEVERIIEREKFDVDWKKPGTLRVAIGDHLLPALYNDLELLNSLGFADHFIPLNEEQSRDILRINGMKGSVLTKPSGVVHPAKLVRQLADLLEKKGVKIYEQTEVTSIEEGDLQNAPKLITNTGTVTARTAAIIAGESYLTQMKGFNRKLIPMYTSIVITEPLSDAQWDEIGWENRETIGSNHLSVDYLQKTADGRILFGLGNSSPYRYGSSMDDSYDTFESSVQLQKRRAMEWFPSLKESQFTHVWGGPIGVTRDWSANIRFSKSRKIAQAWGYAGQGVSTANLAGRILTNLIHEKEAEINHLPMVNHTSRKWEPEPFRWLGAKYIKYKMNKLDEISEQQKIAPNGKTIAERLIRH